MKRAILLATVAALAFGVVSPTASAQPTNFRAVLSGGNEVPEVVTLARGVATFQLSDDGTELTYRLVVANIENVVAAHIHLAPAGVNGPVVAFLFSGAPSGRSNGVLAEGTITAANLVGPLAGQPLSALVTAMEAGNTYANAHTSPAHLGGEIRGQIF
jgi:CHRD domain